MTTSKLITFRNADGNIVSMQGMLANGQFGYWIDEAQPFTDDELQDPKLLDIHLADLAKRVDKSIDNYKQKVVDK